jgi:hypothetical protein
MTKNKSGHDQGIFNDEKRIRKETKLVRPPRLQPKVKEGMMQPIRKKKQRELKGKIPRM